MSDGITHYVHDDCPGGHRSDKPNVMSRSAAKRIEAMNPGEMADRVRKAEATIARCKAEVALWRLNPASRPLAMKTFEWCANRLEAVLKEPE